MNGWMDGWMGHVQHQCSLAVLLQVCRTTLERCKRESCLTCWIRVFHRCSAALRKPQHLIHIIVSPIFSLEAQEQAGEISSQTKCLLVVTCKVYGSAGLGVTELSQETRQTEPRYPETFHIYVHLYLTGVVLTLNRV